MTEIDSILKDAQSVAVSGHVRPDGDCVGSTLAGKFIAFFSF
jgi:phosphoesterase RecJ-like protein